MDQTKKLEVLLKDLKVINENTFPKICQLCGREYHCLDDFGAEQQLKEYELTDKETHQEVIVVTSSFNCVCGSTLMIKAYNRRDDSPDGIRRRQIFDEFLKIVCELEGVDQQDAADLLRPVFLRLISSGQDLPSMIKLLKRYFKNIAL